MDNLAIVQEVVCEPRLVFCPHPLVAEIGRKNYCEPFLLNESILQYLQRLQVQITDRPWILHLNDQFVARDSWPLTIPCKNDLITLRAAVQGGGNGDKNKGIRTVLTIAVLAYAGQYQGVAKLLIATGGSFAIAKMFPPVLPPMDSLRGNGVDSPTYSIAGGSNRARLFEPLPLLLGTHRMFPDIGAKTYTEFVGEDQFLYQVFNFGLGELSLTDFKIGETALDSYQDIETEISGPNGALTLFPANVDITEGATLTESAGWIVRTSSINATALTVELTGLLFYSGNNGIESLTVDIGIEYRAVGDTIWLPFYAAGIATITHSTRQPVRWGWRIKVSEDQYEVRLRRVTLNETDDRATSNITWSQLRAYQPDTANYIGQKRIAVKIRANEQLQGQVGQFNALANNIIQVWNGVIWSKAPSSNPAWLYLHYARGVFASNIIYLLNESFNTDIGGAQTLNATASIDAGRLKHQGDTGFSPTNIYWLLSVTPGKTYTITVDFQVGSVFSSGSISVGSALNGALRNDIASSTLFNANGSITLEFTPTISTVYVLTWAYSPGALVYWNDLLIKEGVASDLENGFIVAGAGLADNQINIEQIKDWGAFCLAKGLSCNLVFDRKMNVEQQLAIIANTGRGAPTRAGGILGVVWDEGNQPVVAHFGMSNIRRDTFKISYASRRDVDEVVVEFINPDLGYQGDSVRAIVPGVSNVLNTKTIQLFGCTDEVMAGAAANLEAAAFVHRRRTITWETDMEGLVVRRGDVVTLSHDLTQWDYSGRLVSGTASQLVLDRTVPFTAGFSHYIGIRFPDGSYVVSDVTFQAGESNNITLQNPLSSAPDADADGFKPWDYTWFFGPQITPGKKVKIIDFRPLNENTMQLVATDEDDAYYLTESDTYIYVPATTTSNTPSINALDISDTLINVGTGYGVRVVLALDITGEYGGMIVRAAPNGEPLQVVARSFDRRAEFIWSQVGNIDIQVTAINLSGEYGDGGSWPQFIYAVEGKSQRPNNVINFHATLETHAINLAWNDVPDADLLDYEIRIGTNWDIAILISRVDTNFIKLDVAAGGTYNYLIKARDTSRNTSVLATPLSVTINLPTAPVITNRFEGGNVILDWSASAGDFPITEYEVRYGSTYAAATFVSTIKASSITIKGTWNGNRRFWVTAVDTAGNYGAPGAQDVMINVPGVLVITRKIIDNYVLLQWTPNVGTLLIEFYEIRRGIDFSSAEVVGQSSGTFNTIFESAAGSYIYWVVAVDAAGNYGPADFVTALVNAPPDFVLREDWLSDFSGTKINAFITQNGELLLPVNTIETWAQHFTNNGWTNPQDQINAGYPYYAMPTSSSAEYEETFDYGTVLEGTLISVIVSEQLITGAVTVNTTISVKKLINDAWVNNVGVEQAYATDFRYVKVKRTYFAVGGDDLLLVKKLNVQLSLKEITDAGNGTALASDNNGTAVLFNKTFVAAESVVVTPLTNNAVFAVVTGYDVINPVGFNVLLFDTVGTRVSGNFGWTVRGN